MALTASSSAATTSVVAIIAVASVCIASLLLVPNKPPPPSSHHRPRRGLASLRDHADPKTVEPRLGRPPRPHGHGHGGPRFVPASPSELRRFSFREASGGNCARRRDVIALSEGIRDLYVEHGVRVFPRNGFLLGVVRHGGFLPNERVDDDLGFVYPDLLDKVPPDERMTFYLGNFRVKLAETEDFWVNWKGIDPSTWEPYPFFRARFSRKDGANLIAYASYPYRDTGGYFYPRLDKAEVNHEAHVADSLRYNKEGADYRLVDMDERMDETNFRDGLQLASYFDTDFDCMMETQFYFTTIIIPCDYDKMLTSQFGRNWRTRVENRGPRGGDTRLESRAVSDEENEVMLAGGPKPLCRAK